MRIPHIIIDIRRKSGAMVPFRQSVRIRVVDVLGGSGFAVNKPSSLFEVQGSYLGGTFSRAWDISPDGQRFLMVNMEERKSQPITEMILVQDCLEEIRRLVPGGKK